MSIQYCTYQQIDKRKWDACIQNATNSLIYAYSFYLDLIAPQWDAIIVNNYEWVCPLPWKKKWGIKYYCTIPFIQQLGFFGREEMIISEAILEMLKKKVPYGDVVFNYSNLLNVCTLKRTNYILPLQEKYIHIRSKYKNDLKKNLKYASKQGLNYTDSLPADDTIAIYQNNYAHRTPHVKKEHYQRFSLLCKQLVSRQMAFTRTIRDHQHAILSTAIFFRDQHRIYNMLHATAPVGKKKAASHFLLDSVIKEFSGQPLILDFEGSDLPGVKAFYETFQPVDQPYCIYHYNVLPFSKFLKKSKKQTAI